MGISPTIAESMVGAIPMRAWMVFLYMFTTVFVLGAVNFSERILSQIKVRGMMQYVTFQYMLEKRRGARST